jgi:hypothetical protein
MMKMLHHLDDGDSIEARLKKRGALLNLVVEAHGQSYGLSPLERRPELDAFWQLCVGTGHFLLRFTPVEKVLHQVGF